MASEHTFSAGAKRELEAPSVDPWPTSAPQLDQKNLNFPTEHSARVSRADGPVHEGISDSASDAKSPSEHRGAMSPRGPASEGILRSGRVEITSELIRIDGFTFDVPLHEAQVCALQWAMIRLREALNA